VDAAKLRAWWWRRQGLDGSLRGAAPAAKAAAAPLDLRPAEPGGDRLLPPGDAAAWRDFAPPAAPRYALVSSLDAITATRRGLAALVDEAVARTTRWVRDDLGDARSFSLDSPASRAPRLRAIRAMR
jgi:hypothetical protein